MNLPTKILLFFVIIYHSNAFFVFESGKNYLFHYKSDTSGTKNWMTLNQTIESDVEIRKIHNDTLLVQLKNVKILDEINKPTSDEIAEMSNPFFVVLNDTNSFKKFLTKDKTFVYCLKIQYRVVETLLSDMSRFTKLAKMEETKTVNVENMAFGSCLARLKVVQGKNETKIGVKAEYKDCQDDGKVNLGQIFDLSPNSTTAAIVTVTKKSKVRKFNTLSDMMTYNMGGMHLKIRAAMTYKGKNLVETDSFERFEDFSTIYTKEELEGFVKRID
ncbi:uncharacterized protein LOC134836830 [Culicoides brevitarsis]|uniref:uncharacterized protein LOC134836830 n=1 Tax=Culicoides brevitarsis TaxID=469753 RepID=UPI00307C2C1B